MVGRMFGITALLVAVVWLAAAGTPALSEATWVSVEFADLCRHSDAFALVTVEDDLGTLVVERGETASSDLPYPLPSGAVLRGYRVAVHRYTCDRTGAFLGDLTVWQVTGRRVGPGESPDYRLGLPSSHTPAALGFMPLAVGEDYFVFLRRVDLPELRAPGVFVLDHPDGVAEAEGFVLWSPHGMEDQVVREVLAPAGGWSGWCTADWSEHYLDTICLGEGSFDSRYACDAAVLVRVERVLGWEGSCWWSEYEAVVEENLAPRLTGGGGEVGGEVTAGSRITFYLAGQTPECPCSQIPWIFPGRRYVLLLDRAEYRNRPGWWIGTPAAIFPVLEPDRVEVHWRLHRYPPETPPSMGLRELTDMIKDLLAARPPGS